MIDWDSDPELRALRVEFVASFKARRAALAALISRLKPAGATSISLAESPALELRVVAHNLSGAAPTYGFENLGRVATEIDERLSDESEQLPASELLKEALRLDKALISYVGFPGSGAKT